MIALQVATAAPTVAATASATGGGASGGALVAGTYYFVVTESNGKGETTAGPESSQLTVSATNIPRVTFQTLKTGNTARNLYVGAVGGSAGGPYTCYVRGVTAATYDMAVAAPITSDATAPPTVNTTGLSTRQIQSLRAGERGDLERVYRDLRVIVRAYTAGQPVPLPETLTHLRESHLTFAALATLCAEIGTLITANPGTIGPATTGTGAPIAVRTWS